MSNKSAKWKALSALFLVLALWAWAMNEDYKDQLRHERMMQPNKKIIYATKTFDDRKWERIEKNREIRRIKERLYEACVRQCSERCK